MNHYILDENRRVVLATLEEWVDWFEAEAHKGKQTMRIVRQETVGEYFISTVFLGLDHNYFGDVPILWETMVFAHPRTKENAGRDLDMDRCGGTWEQAEAMHETMVAKYRALTGSGERERTFDFGMDAPEGKSPGMDSPA